MLAVIFSPEVFLTSHATHETLYISKQQKQNELLFPCKPQLSVSVTHQGRLCSSYSLADFIATDLKWSIKHRSWFFLLTKRYFYHLILELNDLTAYSNIFSGRDNSIWFINASHTSVCCIHSRYHQFHLMWYSFSIPLSPAQVGLIEKAGLRVFKRKDKDSFFRFSLFRFRLSDQVGWEGSSWVIRRLSRKRKFISFLLKCKRLRTCRTW